MLSKKLLKEMQDYLDSNPAQVFDSYANRNDDLSDKYKQMILDGDIDTVTEVLWDYNIDWIMDLETAAIENAHDWFESEMLEELGVEDLEEIDQDELYQELRDNLIPNIDMNISAICESIPVRLELHSDYDCMNSHWLESQGGYSYEESYFGDMVDFLFLNPAALKKHLIKHNIRTVGNYPNFYWRDGKELVNYEPFIEELVNSAGGANLFTVLGLVDIDDILKNIDRKPTKVNISGCACGLFDSTFGSGSLLWCDIKWGASPIKLGQLKKHDNSPSFDMVGDFNSYSVNDVYGTRDMFSDVTLIY